MNWLDRIPLSAFVRLLGALIVGGIAYTVAASGLHPGWFSTPSIVLGVLAGPGLLSYRRWARVPGMLFFGLWLVLGFVILLAGSRHSSGLPLVAAAVCALPILWRWSDDGVSITKV